MEIKVRYIGKYIGYTCPRCLNGTMSREQDKNNLPYLKCILCGKEIREERKFEKTGENAPKRQRFEANAKKIDENKGSKTAIKSNKWQFTQS